MKENKDGIMGHARELDLDELDSVAGGDHCMCEFAGGGE